MRDKKQNPFSAELDHLRDLNEQIADSKYMDDVHVLRASVILKSQTLGLVPNDSWMYFNVEDNIDSEPGVTTRKDVVVISGTSIEEVGPKKFQRPLLRLLSSERFEMEHGDEFLTTDVTIAQDGDAQYLVGLFSISKEGKGEPSSVPYFCVGGDGKLYLTSNYDSTCIGQVFEKVDGVDVLTYPFGHYGTLTDDVQALSVAEHLFSLVKNELPVYTSADVRPDPECV